MAIYDLGTASLAANGEVTGVGTTWKAPLTLIRVGATIVFKTEPVKIYTISEIISDTQVNVYNPNSETVPAGTGYAILAHDGITVQGLAQDVAETLRYYQSRETEVADAVDAFNNFDSADFESKVKQVNTQYGDFVSIGAQVSADAAQVSLDKNAAAASAASAATDKEAAATSAQESAEYASKVNPELLVNKIELSSPLGTNIIGGYKNFDNDFKRYKIDGMTDTQAIQSAINDGVKEIYINESIDIDAPFDFPAGVKLTIGPYGHIKSIGAVRFYGLINSYGGNDPYSGSDVIAMPVTLRVPEDFASIQDAINYIPDNYWQFITVSIADGNYPEDLRIRGKVGKSPLYPPSSGQQAIIVVRSRSSDASKVSINSLQVFSCGGTPFSPNIEKINVVGKTHSDENAAIEFYGCTSGAVNGCHFIGQGVNKCIEAYNSTVSVEACNFGDRINDKAMVVKHGGTIMSNSTQIGTALERMSGILNMYVAEAIGGTIIANDLNPCIGLIAQSRVDGVQAGFVIETSSKSANGLTSFNALETTRFHTQFDNYDKFTYQNSGAGSSITYYPTGGLVLQAGSTGSGSAYVSFRRERRLVNQFETSNYLGFAIAFAKSGSTAQDGTMICGGPSTNNYFGIRFSSGVAKGVFNNGSGEVVTDLSRGANDSFGSFTCKYVGKGNGRTIFYFNGEYAGHIDGKINQYNGTYFDAAVQMGAIQLYELEFVSSK